jgi:glycosyltransferase involved in cell wall biosynthesis
MQRRVDGGEIMDTMPRLVYITTTAGTVENFLKGQLSYMRERGFDVVAISGRGDRDWLRTVREQTGVTTIPVPMEREISPLKDFVSLIRLYTVLRRLRPAIVNAGTPKASLLGMIAACAAGVPVRIYFLLGLRLETTRGMKRFVLGLAERCASACAHKVICSSESLRRRYVALGFSTAAKTCIPGKGSPDGLTFTQERMQQARERARARRIDLGIPDGAPVIGFVGRFTRDKGVPELLDAFDRVLASVPDVWLLMLGCFEDGDSVPESYVQRLRSHPRIIMSGWVLDPCPYYAMMDVVACPSHREGLAGPPLEAAAVAKIPSVGFKVTGTVDAICDGVSGTIVPLGDVASFACALQRYLVDDALRYEHGQAAHKYVLRNFRSETVREAIYGEYVRLLKARSPALFQKLVDYPGRGPQRA